MARSPGNIARLIEFSVDARRDQIKIYNDTAERWGDQQAEIYLNFLLDAVQTLADTPEAARLVPDRAQTRVFVVRWKNARQGHRIFFKEMPHSITITRILHTAMNWQKHI